MRHLLLFFCYILSSSFTYSHHTGAESIPGEMSLITFRSVIIPGNQHTQPNSNFEANRFSFTLSMEKDSLLECQPVDLDLIVKNLNNFEDSLMMFDYSSNILLYDGNSEKRFPPKFFVDNFTISYYLFKANEEKTFTVSLQADFGFVALDSVKNQYGALGYVYPHLPCGKYSVSYKRYAEISNKLSFEIIEPQGQDKDDLEVLKRVYSQRPEDHNVKLDAFYDFLIEHEHSNYYELALREYTGFLSLYYGANNYTNLIGIAEKWFEKDTESELTKQIVRALGAVYKTSFSNAKQDVMTFLSKTILDHPNTIASRWSQSYLDLLMNSK